MNLPLEIKILKLVTERLEERCISYMLSGSVAGNFFGHPRMTRDIDIVIEIGENDTEALMEIFEADFYIDKEMISQAIKRHSMFNIIHLEEVVKIDFIVRKETPYRITEFSRRQRKEYEDFSFWIVALEDLIISKLIWAKESDSETQIRDVTGLVHTAGNLDWEYLNYWAESLGVKELLENIKHE